MGCCQSSGKTIKIGDDSEAVDTLGETVPLNKEGVQPPPGDRPMSSTLKKDGAPSRSATPQCGSLFADRRGSKPGGIAVPVPREREMDPNAINITPQSKLLDGNQAQSDDFAPVKDKDFIEPVRNDTVNIDNPEKKEAVRMFIPWEQPALGMKGNKPPKLGGNRRKSGKKKSGKKGNDIGADLHKRGKKQQVFIPGSGKEKILMAGSKKKKSILDDDGGRVKLAPLKKAKADADTKSAIEIAKKKAKESKSKSRTVNRALSEVGLPDKDIWRLVRQYADIGRRETQGDMLFVPEKREKNNTRTVIKCPIKAE